MKMNSLPLTEVAEIFRRYDNFLIVTHETPDGDALGSVFALLRLFHDNGKTAEVALLEQPPEKYLNFIPSNYRINITQSDLTNYDCCVILDVPNPNRLALGNHLRFTDLPVPAINIDHHPDNIFFAQWNLIEPGAAAAAEILFKIFKLMKHWQFSPQTASLLMLGVVMDTGGFRFDNTSPDLLRIAAELLELDAAYHQIIREMFFANPLSQQQFEAELLLLHLRMELEGRFAWFFIPPELVQKYNVDMRNTEGLIESLRAIRGTEIVAVLQPRGNGFKVSLRSKDSRYPVGNIARKLNGGGHQLAAGCIIDASSRENAEKILLSYVKKVFNEV